MKKLLLFVSFAIMAVALSISCSKDDDSSTSGNGITGGTPYSGALLGTWKISYSETNPNDDWTDSYTFYDDGSFTERAAGSGWWEEEHGLFYVDGNYLVMTGIKGSDSDGDSWDNDPFSVCGYIIESNSTYIEIDFYDADDDYMTIAEAKEKLISIPTSGDKYYKQ